MVTKLTEEQMRAIPALIAQGLTYQKIGETWGFKRVTIEKAVKRLRAKGIEVITRRGVKSTL